MQYTDEGTKIPQEWMPLAMANGIEWGIRRAGFPDRFDCLYRQGFMNRLFWYCGAMLTYLWKPAWINKK